MSFLVEILSHTPIWVWIVLTALTALGLGRTRTRTRSFMSLIAPALIFGAIALAKLSYARFSGDALFGTLIGGAFGLGLVALLRPARQTRRLADGRYLIRGEWTSLMVILAVFTGNYAGAVLAATAPALAATPALASTIAAVNGFSAAFMIGRTLAHLGAGRTPDAPVDTILEG